MLKQDIEQQLKDALKAGNKSLLSTMRFLLSAVKNNEIEKQREATDEDVLEVVQKQVKQHRESIEAYQKAGRSELEAKEKAELDILNKFLPQQLTEEEVKKSIAEIIAQMQEGDKSNFGKIMGMAMAKLKGKTDGNTVSKVVKELQG